MLAERGIFVVWDLCDTDPSAYMNILIDIFLLKVLGWCTPGIFGGPTLTPPSCISCGTVQLFCDFLLRIIFFVSARFASCFLTFQLLPANLVFLPTRF